MNGLRADNVNIMILTKEFEKLDICKQVEPWFQTKYNTKGNFLIKNI